MYTDKLTHITDRQVSAQFSVKCRTYIWTCGILFQPYFRNTSCNNGFYNNIGIFIVCSRSPPAGTAVLEAV